MQPRRGTGCGFLFYQSVRAADWWAYASLVEAKVKSQTHNNKMLPMRDALFYLLLPSAHGKFKGYTALLIHPKRPIATKIFSARNSE